MSDKIVLALEQVTRSFVQGTRTLEVLRGCDLALAEGEIVALVGPSGAGKSTLLQIIGLLEKPTSGTVTIDGSLTGALGDDAVTMLRRHKIGFVYQYHHLLPEFSAAENIVIPQIIAGLSRAEARRRSLDLLGWLGLSERAEHRPTQLSGGEQQRVAIARALANAPVLLLADEPTGNLDPGTAEEVFNVLLKLVKGAGLAALVATHNPELASRMDRILKIENGKLVEKRRKKGAGA